MKNVLYNRLNLKMGGIAMNCMKCGREMTEKQSFCAECLEEMEKYPVKPGAVVHLPRRREENASKKAHQRRKTSQSPEEQIKGYKRLIRVLLATLLVSTILLGVSGYFAVVHLMEKDVVFLPGQNYSSITSGENKLP